MNSEKNMSRRFNIIDLFLIVAIIAVIIFASNVFIKDFFKDNITKIEYTVKVTDVDEQDLNLLNITDRLVINNGNTQVGTIKKIEAFPSLSYVFNYDTDRFVSVNNSSKYDMYITVEASCGKSYSMYHINGNIISSNRELNLTIPFKYTNAIIVNVTPVVEEKMTERSVENSEE